MKILTTLLLFPLSLFAFYTGNPFSPTLLQKGFFALYNSLASVGVGYLGDYVSDKQLLLKERDTINFEKVNHFKMESQMSYLSLILVRRMEIYSYLGVSKEKMEWEPLVENNAPDELKANNHFSYAVGAKAILLEFSSAAFSIDVNYFCLPSSEKVKEKLQSLAFPFSLGNQTLKWKEWNFSLGLAGKLGPLTPYFGGKYSTAKLKVSSTNSSDILRFTGKEHWGIFAGISINISKTLYLTGEWRHFDENALSASAVFAF